MFVYVLLDLYIFEGNGSFCKYKINNIILEITNKNFLILLFSGLLYDHLISLAHESQEISTQCFFTCMTGRLRLPSGLLTVKIGVLCIPHHI